MKGKSVYLTLKEIELLKRLENWSCDSELIEARNSLFIKASNLLPGACSTKCPKYIRKITYETSSSIKCTGQQFPIEFNPRGIISKNEKAKLDRDTFVKSTCLGEYHGCQYFNVS